MSTDRLKLLVINWQDLKNPQAGGAEIHLHEIFGRLAGRGHDVTLLCSGWAELSPREELDGMHVLRVGGRHSFTFLARSYYRKHLRDDGFDLVVEDINKIPLYCPLWAHAPVVALIPHLFGATAFQEASVPFATAVWLAERPLPYFYADAPFQAISSSTANDLVDRGVQAESIRVIYPGIDHTRFHRDPSVQRFEQPTFVYVGRLKRYKGLETVIDALAELDRLGVNARLILAGKGDHEAGLRTVYPSPKEGWGITNIEAAASGTPTLASDSPGLRESVAHEESGLLVRHGSVSAWTDALRRLALDRDLRNKLQAGAARFAGKFSWDRTADETEAHLQEVHANAHLRGDHLFNTLRSEVT
jgi:glycosyltransferase involved in cell wall biosynthesis